MADGDLLVYEVVDDEQKYSKFIEDLRSRLTQTEVAGLPVMVAEDKTKSQCLDIELKIDSYSIIVRVYKVNLYVLGYKCNNEENFWQLKGDYPPIANATKLPFGGSYTGDKCLVATADQNREDILLGYQTLRHYILGLCKGRLNDDKQRARALLFLTQFISESARFKLITEHIVKNWKKPEGLSSKLVKLQNKFDYVSMGFKTKGEGFFVDMVEIFLAILDLKIEGRACDFVGILMHVDTKSKVKESKQVELPKKSHVVVNSRNLKPLKHSRAK